MWFWCTLPAMYTNVLSPTSSFVVFSVDIFRRLSSPLKLSVLMKMSGLLH